LASIGTLKITAAYEWHEPHATAARALEHDVPVRNVAIQQGKSFKVRDLTVERKWEAHTLGVSQSGDGVRRVRH
jgi:hypothetical protein